MREGRFRDGFPRLTLPLPGHDGEFEVEFLVDTGYDGGLSVPPHIAQRLDVGEPEVRLVRVAGGILQRCLYYEIPLENDEGEEIMTEVLVLEGNALVGNVFLAETLLEIEMTEGGGVTIESL